MRFHLHPCNNRLSLRCFPPVPWWPGPGGSLAIVVSPWARSASDPHPSQPIANRHRAGVHYSSSQNSLSTTDSLSLPLGAPATRLKPIKSPRWRSSCHEVSSSWNNEPRHSSHLLRNRCSLIETWAQLDLQTRNVGSFGRSTLRNSN